MGNGLSDYWRERRAYENEQKVMKHLLDFLQALIYKRPTFRVSMQEMDKAGFGFEKT